MSHQLGPEIILVRGLFLLLLTAYHSLLEKFSQPRTSNIFAPSICRLLGTPFSHPSVDGRQMWMAPQHALCAHRQGLGGLQRVRQPGRDQGVNVRDLYNKPSITGKIFLRIGSCKFGLLLHVNKMKNCEMWSVAASGSAVTIGVISGNMVAKHAYVNARAASFIILILSHTRSHRKNCYGLNRKSMRRCFNEPSRKILYTPNVKISQTTQIL